MRDSATTALAEAYALLSESDAAASPMAGGPRGTGRHTIHETAVTSVDHGMLVAALEATELAATLNATGPFTLFAPVDSAFAALPGHVVDSLLRPENKPVLHKMLCGHVVTGSWTLADIAAAAERGPDGSCHLETLSGDPLSAQVKQYNVLVLDGTGNAATVTIADLDQSNGVVHVIDQVLVAG